MDTDGKSGDKLSRRGFLRGRHSDPVPGLRPPWAVDEERFIRLCTRCGRCATACTQHVIAPGDGAFPVMAFERGECLFCGACVAACEHGALVREHDNDAPWDLEAVIGERCLALNRVVCRTCADACESRALRFRPMPGGVARPGIDSESCTGCGACVAPCPVGAIRMRRRLSTPAGHA